MAIKQFNARITMKRDTAANWEQNNPVLLNGEIIIVDTASGEVRFKIGDGTKLYKQLPFSDEAVRALISAKQDEISLTENKAVISDASGKLSVSEVTSTELSYLDGVSSNLQTQIDNKVSTTRKINSKPLSSDITLNASDVHALPDTTSIPTKTSELTNDSNFVTQSILNDGLNGKLDKADAGSDWNQNDDTRPDYVKNRPFYAGDPVETVFVEESTVEFVDKNGAYMALFPSSFNAEFGQTYKISWDGTVYECTCENYRNIPIIGNQSMMGVGSDTGEPFIIINQSGLLETGWTSGTLDTSASHTISISSFVVPIIKIDEKYLPEATNISSGVTKIQVRNLDTTKSYSTEEIEEIYQSVRAGTAIYLTYGTVIVNVSYIPNDSFTYTLPTGQEDTIHPVDGVWDFTNRETKYQREVIFNAQSGNYPAYIYCDAELGGNTGSGYELVRTNMDGFRGDYIQADNAIVLKLKNNTKYLYVKANKNGEIEVTKRDSGLISGGDVTTLFQNGDDSMILKSSTPDSTKKFKITVDDSGAITATEVT